MTALKAGEEVSEFLDYLTAERGLSKNTYTAYQKDLEQFLLFCKKSHLDIAQISLKELRDYLALHRRMGLSNRSLARKLSSLKQFYKFLLREDKIEKNPAELLSVQVKGKHLPTVLKEEEINRLIESAGKDGENGIRDRALLEFWYATGARVSEVADLKISYFDWKQGTVKILGKGGRERLVPVNTAALEWCQKYRAIRHEWLRQFNLKEVDAFFLTRTGRAFTRQGIWKLVKKYGERAGLGKRIWPHLIRHSFATHVLQGGADLRAVQELLGHRSIATTEIYTHLDIENLKVMQLKYHPRG